MEIAVDFDGTCVNHEYPHIGKDNPYCIEVLKALNKKGHKLILFTMRGGNELEEAVDWFRKNEVDLYGINTNPTQSFWTLSPKAYAQVYIDDAALGCPLDYKGHYRPRVDWYNVETLLRSQGIL